MKSFLLSSLAAASTLAIGALAFAGDATFELWSSVVDKERSYALVNMETQETVAISGSGRKLALKTGDAADATLENLKAQMPENVEIVASIDRTEPAVEIFHPGFNAMNKIIIPVMLTAENEIWIDNKKVSFGQLTEVVEELLRENPKGEMVIRVNNKAKNKLLVDVLMQVKAAGAKKVNVVTEDEVTVDRDSEDVTEIITENISEEIIESENGKKHVRIMIDKSGDRTIIKGEDLPEDVRALLREEGVTVEGDKQVRIIRKEIDVVSEGDGTSKKTIVSRTAPDTPTPPDAPLVTDGGTNTKIITRSKKKSSYEYHDDGDKGEGMEKSFTHFSGASPEDAAEFIDEIEGLKRRQKKQAKTALGL